MSLQVIQVIETFLERRGKGVPDDPIRVIQQYWSMDGRLLWEVDPWLTERELKPPTQTVAPPPNTDVR